MTTLLVLLAGLAGAAGPPPQPEVVILISADAEWREVRAFFHSPEEQASPVGEWWLRPDPRAGPAIFLHAGWGKVASGAATQYAIDRWKPRLLVNLGTCGGFDGDIDRGAVLLVTKTIAYDIKEAMGDGQEAIDHYATDLGAWSRLWPDDPGRPLLRHLLISADRDIEPAEIPELRRRFGAIAADWESAAIAYVAARNRTPVIILRGVSDLVGAKGGEAYGNLDQYAAGTRAVMRDLLTRLPEALSKIRLSEIVPKAP